MAGRCGIGVLAPRRGEGRGAKHRLNRPVDAVVAINASEMPLHHLRHGVFLVGVEAVQLGNRHVQQCIISERQ